MTLSENITRAIVDFDSIKTAIIEKGVDVSNSIPTSQYADKIRAIEGGESKFSRVIPEAIAEMKNHIEDVDSTYQYLGVFAINDISDTYTFNIGTGTTVFKAWTSDGSFYNKSTTTAFNVTHTWDKSKDIDGKRYIVYVASTQFFLGIKTIVPDADKMNIVLAGLNNGNISFSGGANYLNNLEAFYLGENAQISSFSNISKPFRIISELPNNSMYFNSTAGFNSFFMSCLEVGDINFRTLPATMPNWLTTTGTGIFALIRKIGTIDASNVTTDMTATSTAQPFFNYNNLRDFGGFKGLKVNCTLYPQVPLNRQSCRNIIDQAKDMTGETAIVITFGPFLLPLLTAEDIKAANDKNITLA